MNTFPKLIPLNQSNTPPSAIYKIMSEQESPNIEIKDRSEQQRKFGCPCGKWYLSYPALFTHVKQKHDGRPPGNIIKPKTDKARGRPRLPTSTTEDDQSIINYDCAEQLQKALLNKTINYNQQVQLSEGHETCQDMASDFLKIVKTNGEEKKIVNCFINYIKFYVYKKYEKDFWETNKPTDLIDISNEIVRSLEIHKEMFPIQKETLIDLLYILFRWMYKNKWTDHKLVRRNTEPQEINKQNKKI